MLTRILNTQRIVKRHKLLHHIQTFAAERHLTRIFCHGNRLYSSRGQVLLRSTWVAIHHYKLVFLHAPHIDFQKLPRMIGHIGLAIFGRLVVGIGIDTK